jgi:hypothetical protein
LFLFGSAGRGSNNLATLMRTSTQLCQRKQPIKLELAAGSFFLSLSLSLLSLSPTLLLSTTRGFTKATRVNVLSNGNAEYYGCLLLEQKNGQKGVAGKGDLDEQVNGGGVFLMATYKLYSENQNVEKIVKVLSLSDPPCLPLELGAHHRSQSYDLELQLYSAATSMAHF